MPGKKAARVSVEQIIPILNVKSLRASIRYYVDVLGFGLDWKDGAMASVSSGGKAIMLSQGGQGRRGTWVWIGVEDITPLFARYRARRAKIRRPPTNHPWAYEMQIEDPDGHVLRFGSEPKAEESSD